MRQRTACGSPAEALQETDERINEVLEQVAEDTTQINAVEQACDRAQQVPQEVARPRDRCYIEDDLVQLDTQTQEIQIERAQCQMEYRADCRLRRRCRH
jgi:hypothetical protein